MVSRTLMALVLILSIAMWCSLAPSPVRAQGAQYGQDLKEAGKDLGEANKEAFKPSDGKDRNVAEKVGHAGKESGKGTGRFFKGFGRSTRDFFKRIFGGKN
jgi:hypothetical protein